MERFKNILCVVDPEKVCTPVIERALALAENNQADLTFVGVVPRITAGIDLPEGGPISAELQAAMVAAHRQKLELLLEPCRKRTEIQTKVLTGVPFLEIIREVLSNGRDLVIKLPESRDWLDRLFGSDDMHLLRKCPCPVWLIKAGAPKHYRRILAAVDVDEAYPPAELKVRRALNLQIMKMTGSLVLSEFAELHVVHAWDAVGESTMRSAFVSMPKEKITAYVEQVRRQRKQAVDALLRETGDKLGRDAFEYLKPQIHLVKGSARREIPAMAKQVDADLVVMGTVARIGIPGFIMGNTAETILNHIDCSVLAVKPPGFATPVTLED